MNVRLIVLMTHDSPWANSVATSLCHNGHDVHVVDLPNSGVPAFHASARDLHEYHNRYEHHELSTAAIGRLRYVVAAGGLRKLARTLRPDALLVLYSGGFALTAFLSMIRPYVLYVVGSDVLLAGPVRRKLNRVLFRSAAHVFANGRYLAERAAEQAPGAHIEELLLGIDLSKLRPAVGGQVPRMINHRTFDDVYNNEDIVRAIARFPPDFPAFELVFLSGGPKLQSAIRLADRSLPVSLRQRVKFLGGGLDYDRVTDELSRSDIYISMSRSDGTATSVLEAMGTGLFPILSDIPQNRPLIDADAANGALVSLGDVQSLSLKMQDSLLHVAACRSKADHNRAVIRRIGDASKNRSRLIHRLEEVAGCAPANPGHNAFGVE